MSEPNEPPRCEGCGMLLVGCLCGDEPAPPDPTVHRVSREATERLKETLAKRKRERIARAALAEKG